MKIMSFSRFADKALALSLLLAVISASSMVTLAASTKPVGELIVSGGKADVSVTVNGEPATTGRTVFSASSITTPEGVTAILNLGKAGRIELGPNTTFVIDGDGNAVSGSLSSGNITVLSAPQAIGVKTLSGETVTLNAGDSANSTSSAAAKAAKPGPGGIDWWIWAAIIGGATAIIIVAATAGDDDNPTSPIR